MMKKHDRLKDKLYKYNKIHIYIKLSLEKLESLRQSQVCIDNLKSSYIKEVMVDTKVISDPVYKGVAAISENLETLVEYIAKELNELINLEIEVKEALESLVNKKELDIIEMRYIRNLKWHEIAATVNYELRQCHRIHGNALEKLSEVI